ncbi:MAG: MATE family efflux transporter [Leptotrichiaceae bacterium]|nr:MATE family efflux transporter [Leptotrichiaceae bacterium]
MDNFKKTTAENKMGTMPVNKLIINMSLPMITSMFIQALYNIVDSYFVAKIGEDALTAVSLSFPLQNMMIAAGIGTGIGLNALLSRYLGAKNGKGITKIAENGIFLGVLNSIVFLIFGIFFTKAFFSFQTESEIIAKYGTQYLSLCSVFAFSIIMEITFERMLQATGKTFFTMITQSTGAIINIIMDPILIFGLFGFPKMGISGAATATVFGQSTAMLLALYFNLTKNKEITFKFRNFKPDFSSIINIYKIGFPSIIMMTAASFLIFQLNKILLAFSSTATAVLGIYFKIQGLVFMPVFGLNNAVISIVSYNYGAGNIKRLIRTVKLSIAYAMGIMFAGIIICQVFPVQILKIFDASDEMIKIGVKALRTISLCFILAAYSFVLSSVFQALGRGMLSLAVSLVRQIVFTLPLAFIFSKIWGLDGIWWAFPIAEIFSGILTTIFLKNVYKNNIIKRIRKNSLK